MPRKQYMQFDLTPPLRLDGYILYHTGYSHAKDATFIPEHYHHQTLELTAFTEGLGQSYAGDAPTDVRAGDIFVSFPFERHRVPSDEEKPLSFVFVSFRVTTPKFEGALAHLWRDNPPPTDRLFRNEKVFALIRSIFTEFERGPGRYSSELIAAALEQIVIYLLRAFADRVPKPLSEKPTEEELCLRLAHYIDTHLLSMKHLSECADSLSYNYCYLATLFKRKTGTTLSDYYRMKRLEMAKFLIEEHECSLTEIAETLNYSGLSAFSKAFHRRFGLSPREYEKNCREK